MASGIIKINKKSKKLKISKDAIKRCSKMCSSCHAEAAMAKYLMDKKNFKKYTMVVVRFLADGSLAESMPCRDCMILIRMFSGLNVIAYHIDKFVTVPRERIGRLSTGARLDLL